MKRKLGIICECIRGEDPVKTLDLIKAAGFDCFFTGTQDPDKVAAIVAHGKELGLTCEFIHAPFKGINTMWLAGLSYLPLMNGMKQAIDNAAANGVPAVIIHVSSGWDAPEITDLGLARFDELVLYATEKKVTIAFENLRKVGNLAYFADRYEKMEYVRFCYDCGHEHCYTKYVTWMDIFRNKLVATHIHDNHGRGDEAIGDPDTHLLPFDGTFNYEKMMRKLDEYNFEGALVLEVGNSRECYAQWTAEEFLATCFERIKKISEL
ncbi:MAG: sugar phosphate isomerase/epimerase [Ruminococcaceae bacterium]|nr:sugar phosphate isomerase/epimerase [Oscillospiraceae bacterium]